jgi:hypothetical protein
VIAHLVLFQPRRDLTEAQRQEFAASFERALTEIAEVRRARVGVRKTVGRFYDRTNEKDFPYVALIEFDSEADLRSYLDHPAHRELGRLFYETGEAALVFDYELSEGENVRSVFAS